MEVVRLDEFVEIDAQELHRNAEMSAEVEVLRHLDDIVFLIRILFAKTLYINDDPHALDNERNHAHIFSGYPKS